MKQFDKLLSTKRIIIICFVLGVFIIYPRIIDLPRELSRIAAPGEKFGHLLFFSFRYLFFCLLTWILLTINVLKQQTSAFTKRLLKSFLIALVAYVLYVLISIAVSKHADCFTGLLLFQFVIACLICAFIGHFSAMYSEQRKQEHEIEKLKMENLQSRCEALANQINPHFFFNSLNGLTALVRSEKKAQTLEYINKLSSVFRYILQSDKKGLVTLSEELRFLDSFRYLQEIRYAAKFWIDIKVSEKKQAMLIPVLSLLPLIENVVKHNMIDSENPMHVSIFVNEQDELVVANPVHRKIDPPERNGIGLRNLSDRFLLLQGKEIRIESNEEVYRVYLPLNNLYV